MRLLPIRSKRGCDQKGFKGFPEITFKLGLLQEEVSTIVLDVKSYGDDWPKFVLAPAKPSLSASGVTLGFGVTGGKPKILLNLTSSVDEACDWNPAIMKVAKTIK